MMKLIEEIIGHLGAAKSQRSTTDDAIISKHLDDALAKAQTLRRRINELEAELEEKEGWEL